MLALFVLALAALLRELVAQQRIGPRAAPLLALLAAGTVLIYSYPGLAWIAGTIGLAAAGLLVTHRRLLRRDVVLPALRRALPTLGVLAVALLVALASQVSRLQAFFDQLSLSPSGSGVITEANIGNLVGPVSPYEVLGVWLREDFRFGPSHEFRGGMLAAVALVALLFAVIWWLRRREVVVLAAAGASRAAVRRRARGRVGLPGRQGARRPVAVSGAARDAGAAGPSAGPRPGAARRAHRGDRRVRLRRRLVEPARAAQRADQPGGHPPARAHLAAPAAAATAPCSSSASTTTSAIACSAPR